MDWINLVTYVCMYVCMYVCGPDACMDETHARTHSHVERTLTLTEDGRTDRCDLFCRIRSVVITLLSVCLAGPQEDCCPRECAGARGRETVSLLGLMAKIKCSICSYQFNIWYAFHSVGSYINLIFGIRSRERGLPHPDHGLPRRCTTVERGPFFIKQIEIKLWLASYLLPSLPCIVHRFPFHPPTGRPVACAITVHGFNFSLHLELVGERDHKRNYGTEGVESGGPPSNSYLPDGEVKPDQRGVSSRVRPLHCTSLGLTSAIATSVVTRPYNFW